MRRPRLPGAVPGAYGGFCDDDERRLVPEGAIGGTRYTVEQMRHLDSER
jgi:hypothetical protein